MGVVQVQASFAKLLKTFSSHPLHVHWITWVDPFIQALHGSEGGTNAKHLHQLDGATYVIHIAESNPLLSEFGYRLSKHLATTRPTKCGDNGFTVNPFKDPREGASAMLLWEGTLANQEIIPAASSTSSSFPTKLSPGNVRAVPLILTSLVELLSM